MNIWAIADLHLCFGTPEKSMEIFGKDWENYTTRIKENWKKKVKKEDLVLIAGDLSWAKDLNQALIDFTWLDNLPGKKILIKGNHDYWWGSSSKLKAVLPKTIKCIHNDAFNYEDISIGGTRLWDCADFNFDEYIKYKKNPKASKEIKIVDAEKIYERELHRLHLSLEKMNKKARLKIVMTHFPPISADLKESKVSQMLEAYKIDICVFGHLHHAKKEKLIFGEKNNIKYLLTSADFLEFKPLKLI